MNQYIPREITTRNLEQATAQEVLDWVTYSLLLQNRKSMDPEETDVCLYRGKDACKCAAGHLIHDSDYREELEGESWCELVRYGHVPSEHSYLIARLQDVHDGREPYEWSNRLRAIAQELDLEYRFNGFINGMGWPHPSIEWAKKLDFTKWEICSPLEPYWTDTETVYWRINDGMLQAIDCNYKQGTGVLCERPCPETEEEFIALVQRMRMGIDY